MQVTAAHYGLLPWPRKRATVAGSSASLSGEDRSCLRGTKTLVDGNAIELMVPDRTLKLILDVYPVLPSSYSFRAASYSSFSCSA